MRGYLVIQESGPTKNTIRSVVRKIAQSVHSYTEAKGDPTAAFLRNKRYIDTSDFVIAEVTSPSTDIGGIVVYALTKGKPVLALIHGENENKLTPLLKGNPSEWLFLEHYTEDSLPYVLKNFLDYCKGMTQRVGKLVVIDGGDGSGKATQASLLSNYLTQHAMKHRTYDFPRYYTSFHGSIVGRMLKGEFGEFDSISPYLSSLAYALDRASVREEMSDFLKRGGFIISNRYATSSMAHQSAKFKKTAEQETFLEWIYDLEYKKHKIPKEDVVIYLYVPWKFGLELDQKKSKRNYLGDTQLDLAESNIQHRIASEKMYLSLCKAHTHWIKINCVENNTLRSREDIHTELLSILHRKKLL